MEAFIRSASARDIEALSRLLGQCWHETYDSIHGPERVAAITAEWHAPAALKKLLDAPGSEFLVADTGSRLTGMAYARQKDKTILLQQIYVAREAQGAGLGTAFIQEIIECFPEAVKIVLEVDEANDGAIGFYMAGGFSVIGKTANCGKAGSGIPALIMEFPII